MPDEIKAQMPDGKTLVIRPIAETVPTFYVNNVVFSLTQWDIRADLHELRGFVANDDADPNSITANVVRRVSIVMTVPYAKSFVSALVRHIAKYEEIAASKPPQEEDAAKD